MHFHWQLLSIWNLKSKITISVSIIQYQAWPGNNVILLLLFTDYNDNKKCLEKRETDLRQLFY